MLAGLLGALLGVVAALVVHWAVIQPSDDELRGIARTLTPSGFTLDHEPVVSGAWPLSSRGVLHVDATSPELATLGAVADGLRAGGWWVEDVDPDDGTGYVHATRDGVRATVFLASGSGAHDTTASISVGRGPQGTSLAAAAVVGVVAGAAVGAGAVVAARRVRAGRH